MLLRGTMTERHHIRKSLLRGDGEIDIGENEDGTWFADVSGVIVEGESAAQVLRELAKVLEES
jgi:hypothetical protein